MRYASGVSDVVAFDEVVRVVGGRARRAAAPRLWRGTVVAVQGGLLPRAFVAEGGGDVVGVFEARVLAKAAVEGGVGVRVWRSLGGEVSNEATGVWLIKGMRGRAGRKACLLPTRFVVFEVGGERGFWPKGAEDGGRVTLAEVWERKSLEVDWVCATVASAAEGVLKVRDGDDGPVVDVRLSGGDAVFGKMFSVGDRLLAYRPGVEPCDDSFALEIGDDTVLYAVLEDSCGLKAGVKRSVAEKQEDLVVPAPPTKRQRVALEGADDADLSELGAVSLADMQSLRQPEKQRPFDLFCTVSKVGASSQPVPQPGASDPVVPFHADADDACVHVVDGGATSLDIACSDLGKPCAELAAGHVLYFCDVQFKASRWRAKQFVNVSILPGVLNSTFLRTTVGVEQLHEVVGLRRPDTVHVHVRVTSITSDLSRRLLVLDVLDVNDGEELDRVTADTICSAVVAPPVSHLSVTSEAVLLHLVGMKKREFWKGFEEGGGELRSTQLGHLVGKTFNFAVALSLDADGAAANRISAICASRK